MRSEREIAEKKLAAYGMTPFWFKKNYADLSVSHKRYLADFIRAYPEFGILLRIKESFRELYEYSVDVEDAENRYNEWVKSIPEDNAYHDFLWEVIPMIDRHHVEIFNYFVDPPGKRYSNGPVESINCQIKDVMRIAKGASFDTIRAKVLYGEGRVATSTSIATHRKAPKGPRYEALMRYMDGIRTDEITSSVRSCIEAFLLEDIKRYSKEYSYENALQQIRESGQVDNFLHSVCWNNNIYARLLEGAELLDAEEHPEHPVFLGVTKDEFVIEALLYFLNGENMSVPLIDYTEESNGLHIHLM